MPLLLALGLVTVVSNMYFNKSTIDRGDFHPQAWGYDTRNLGIGGGLVLAVLGAATAMPLLAAAGLGLATGAFTNRQVTGSVERGLRQIIRSEIDRDPAALSDVPPPSLVLPDAQVDNLNPAGTRPPRPSSMLEVLDQAAA